MPSTLGIRKLPDEKFIELLKPLGRNRSYRRWLSMYYPSGIPERLLFSRLLSFVNIPIDADRKKTPNSLKLRILKSLS